MKKTFTPEEMNLIRELVDYAIIDLKLEIPKQPVKDRENLRKILKQGIHLLDLIDKNYTITVIHLN
jgi:hypothetical protein